MKEIEIVAVSDTHCGSENAICVPLEKGGRHRNSTAQRALYDKWELLAKEWAEPDILVHLGDAVEGQARKESGVPCWTTDLDEQIECAAHLLRMFKARKIYLINGTGYHVDAGGQSVEAHLGAVVGAEKIGPRGQQSAEELFLEACGKTFHFSHHISVGMGWYRTTPLARELVFALLSASDHYKVDVLVRGHVHYFCGVEFERQHGYIAPCWQLRTRFAIRKSAMAMFPSIGALRFRLSDGYINLDKRFFKPPEIKPKLHHYEA